MALGRALDAALVCLVAVGVLFRFNWTDWSRGTNLHPDEYGLTNTLSQLSMPGSLAEYFNTRSSPLSPYQKYDAQGIPTIQGPDNRMRWGQLPILIIRWAGEQTGDTGYGEIRLLGRKLSALADSLSLMMTFLIARRLYDRKVALVATAFGALAVMQIQQSHFMTADPYGVLFTTVTMYFAVRISQRPGLRRSHDAHSGNESSSGNYTIDRQSCLWYALFGIGIGSVLATRINLLLLAGMIGVAAFTSISGLGLRTRTDLYRIALGICGLLVLAALTAGLTFRIAQPMSFRNPTGDTTFLTLYLNRDWVDSMRVAQEESNGIGGGPPAEQWANRPAILFPLVNMVLWGMGVPLGCLAWAGLAAAVWSAAAGRSDSRLHALPAVWAGAYFLFMGTRWVKSIRYFLPVYPFFCILAAWAVVALARSHPTSGTNVAPGATPTRIQPNFRGLRKGAAVFIGGLVLIGTGAWANAFVTAVYRTDHTRIQATKWIMSNVPAPLNLTLDLADGASSIAISAPDQLTLGGDSPFVASFSPPVSGTLRGVTIPHITLVNSGSSNDLLRLIVSMDPDGLHPLAEAHIDVASGRRLQGNAINVAFNRHPKLEVAKVYYLIVPSSQQTYTVSRSVISNEGWDEGLPLPMYGHDPYGEWYSGITMEVRWYDDDKKRQMFLDNLARVDYIILPSQRGIWSVARLPLTYPMTLEYYRALFDGRLGFELVRTFTSPMRMGPIEISDVAGSLGWGTEPKLPLFNCSLLAAEEAFSVYDHPPVWIFKKGPNFSIDTARRVVEATDLTKVIVQSPRDAALPACN